MTTSVYIDFETRSIVDLKRCGSYVYAKHASTDVLCLAYAFDDEPVRLWKSGDEDPTALLKYVANKGRIVGHNLAGFELLIWNNVCVPRFNWPRLSAEQLICTMTMAYAMSLPGSLEKAAAAVGIQQQKDTAGSRVMLQLAQPRSFDDDGNPIWWNDETKFQRLYDYCKQDVEVERELFKRLVQLSESEKEVWLLDTKINQRGVAVDLPAIKKAIELVKAEKKRLNIEIQKVTNDFVATCDSTGQLTDWLKWQGVDLDGVAKADVLELLSRDDLPVHCRKALLLRQEAAKSSTAKLESMLNCACPDERIRGIFQYHGASTGRWSGRRIQPQNFPRSKLNQQDIENVFNFLRGIE